jgi:hypothetical protein
MEKLYCLFSISSNTLYTTIQGCRPTSDYVMLENLRFHVAMVKPPGPSSTMEILETDASCIPTAAAQDRVQRIREGLS